MRKYNLLEGKEAKFARFGCNFQEKLIRNAFFNEVYHFNCIRNLVFQLRKIQLGVENQRGNIKRILQSKSTNRSIV